MLVVRKPTEATWKPVLGAEVLFAPVDRAMLRKARREAMDALGQEGEEVDLEELGDAFSMALITAGAKDWRGVCEMADDADAGAGEPLPFSAENLAAALSDPITFEAFDQAYVRPFILLERERAAPGNGSAASPAGTGQAATPESDIATSHAVESDDAASARTASTKRKRTPKKRSGRS